MKTIERSIEEADLRRFKTFVETRGDQIEGRPAEIPARPDAGQRARRTPEPRRR